MNRPTYTVLDRAEFAQWPDVIHTQARALLIAASALIQRGWCRYHRALSAQGRPVAPDDDQAQDRDEGIDRLRQALEGYDALVRDDRFCSPQYPKADGEALHYIERIEQSVIPGPCSQKRPHPTIGA